MAPTACGNARGRLLNDLTATVRCMKDLLISALVTVVLILLFSIVCFPDDIPFLFDGNSPKYPGDSGTVLPGNGTEIVEVVAPETQQPTESETEGESESAAASEEIHTEIPKEKEDSMNELTAAALIGAAAGVAAVLLGETAALLVAAAWKKIRGGKDG
jgi:hypothetical protein